MADEQRTERILCRVECRDDTLVEAIHGTGDAAIKYRNVTSPGDRKAVLADLPGGVVATTTPLQGAIKNAVGLRIWVDGLDTVPDESAVDDAVRWLVDVAVHRRKESDRETLRMDLEAAVRIARAAVADDRLEVRRVAGVRGFVVAMPFPTSRGIRVDLVVGVGQDRYWLSTQGLKEFIQDLSLRKGITPGTPARLRLYRIVDELDTRWERLEGLIEKAQDGFNNEVASGMSISVTERMAEIGRAMRSRTEESKHVAPLHRAVDMLSRAASVVEPEEDDVADRVAAADVRLEIARAQLTDLQQAVIATASYEREQRGESLQTAVTLGTGALLVPGLVAGIFGANVAPLSRPDAVYLGPFLLVIAAASSLALTALVAAGSLSTWGRLRWAPAAALGVTAMAFAVMWAIPGSLFNDHWNGFPLARWSWLGAAILVIVAAAAKKVRGSMGAAKTRGTGRGAAAEPAN
jgi:CorA-like Mg2+ transporter protein